MKTMLFLLLTLLAPQDPPQDTGDAQPPDPRVTLERAAFAEEYERDLDRAEALYTLAVAVAKAQGDESTAQAAAAALARVQARRAGAPAAAAIQQDAAIVERIGELLQGLSQIPLGIDGESPQWANYQAITTDLAVYGDAVVPWLEALLAPDVIEIGTWRVQLDTRMAARRLAQLNTDAANAALARALQARDPLIRRAVAEELSWNRHQSLLEQAARDAVPQVRSVAVQSLVRVQDPELLPVIEPEAMAGDSRAVKWMMAMAPERLLERLQAPDATPAFLASATNYLDDARLPATPEVVEALLRLTRELEDPEQRLDVLRALTRYFGKRNPWAEAPPALREQVQERLLAEPELYPRQAAFELLAEIGDFETYEYLSRELARWPADRPQQDTHWLENATGSLVTKIAPKDFDRLAALYRELPLDPAEPADQFPRWQGNAIRQLSELVDEDDLSVESVARGYAGLEGVRRTAYFHVLRNWMASFRGNPEFGTKIRPLLPVLREMLEEEERGSANVAAAVGGLATAGDFDSLPRILEILDSSSTRDNSQLRQAAWIAVENFYQQDPDRTAEVVVAAILADRVGPDAIHFLQAPRGLEAFRRLWPELEDETRRQEALSTLVTWIQPGGGADAAVAEMYPVMTVPQTRVRAIQHFGLHLFEPAIPVLGQALEDPDPGVREQAREAFHAFQEHREALEEFAAWTLGDRQARQQIDELIALLDDPDDEVVLGAVKALGAVRARAALPALVRLLANDDPAIQAAVHEAIDRIGQ